MRSLFLAARRSRPAKIRTGGTRVSGAPKKTGGLPGALQVVERRAVYRWLPRLQAAWEREVARLFGEFWRSGDQKHLRAFVTHGVAKRVHAGRHTP